ncbi:protein-glutamate O-methyltransferase CheR [Amorphus sp. 3PC139-8]|uniref:CheR family methyltransferase n=1 Tax=Amorphus sp. 3PC139-8 TaxID=2735676 RepID=UPI00345D4005
MISPSDYDFLQKFLRTRSGLALSSDKQYLLESRLGPIARQFGCAGVAELTQLLRRRGSEAAAEKVVDAMTTNESLFFRDKHPFEAFTSRMLPTVLANRPVHQPVRIWCAAASSGQEPYSLAMLITENPAITAGRRFEILATDISNDILTKATRGVYSQFEVQRGLPMHYLARYFSKVGDDWQVSDKIRSMVTFRKMNLLDPYTGIGMFDIVFCRNVLIYFDNTHKTEVLNRMAKIMHPDSFLVLGGAESVIGLTEQFQPDSHRCLFRPQTTASAMAFAR